MNVTLINMTAVEVPLSYRRGQDFVVSLEPGGSHSINDERVTVITVGDNPSLREDMKGFVEEVGDKLLRLLTFWRQHAPSEQKMVGARPAPVVRLAITNDDPDHGLRIMPGDDQAKEFELQPGESCEAIGLDFVEIRELGVGEDEDNTDQTG